jgi:hypothetical protein
MTYIYIYIYPKLTLSFGIPHTPATNGFGGLVVSILATGTRVRGFKPGRSHWIFSGIQKNPQYSFLRKGSKIICPMSQLYGMSKIPSVFPEIGGRE